MRTTPKIAVLNFTKKVPRHMRISMMACFMCC